MPGLVQRGCSFKCGDWGSLSEKRFEGDNGRSHGNMWWERIPGREYKVLETETWAGLLHSRSNEEPRA